MSDNGDGSEGTEERGASSGGGQTPPPHQGDQPPQGVQDNGQRRDGGEPVLQAQDEKPKDNDAPGPTVQQPGVQITINVQTGTGKFRKC